MNGVVLSQGRPGAPVSGPAQWMGMRKAGSETGAPVSWPMSLHPAPTPCIPIFPSLPRAIRTLCTRGVQEEHKGCTSLQPISTRCTPLVPLLYTRRDSLPVAGAIFVVTTEFVVTCCLPDSGWGETIALVTVFRGFQPLFCWQATMKAIWPGLGGPNGTVYSAVVSDRPLVAGPNRLRLCSFEQAAGLTLVWR